MAEKGKLSKTARASTHFGSGTKQVVIEHDSTRGKVFTEVKNSLKESGVGFKNVSSSHPILVNKGEFDKAWEVIKGVLVDDGRYNVESENPGEVVIVENTNRQPAKMVIKESPFTWYKTA
ncbi:MAG: hypothetical protein J6U98_09725 [Abditibacteriota bacterium]|nr:hypothetical protein [Abditibacteriota bacterium]MBP5092926.1 hypothetical protein [Abditibacteriota bacterium]MBP5738470.1 hypothetical protein [Abditibacteriota bacterium]